MKATLSPAVDATPDANMSEDNDVSALAFSESLTHILFMYMISSVSWQQGST